MMPKVSSDTRCRFCDDTTLAATGKKWSEECGCVLDEDADPSAHPLAGGAFQAGKAPEDKRLRLLVVDDSRFIRNAIRRIVETSDRIEVIGEAGNGKEALEQIPLLNPDVITLDVNMPVMDGLTTLKHIMIKHPRPTVMLSTLTREGATVTFDALKYGAVDFLEKPSNLGKSDATAQERRIIRKILMAGEVEIGILQYLRTHSRRTANVLSHRSPCERVIAVGAAEGSLGSILKIIPGIDANHPAAILLMLYESSANIDAFAEYLDAHSALRVRRAGDGDVLESGTCYLGSGEDYMTVEIDTERPALRIHPNPFPNRRGAINMLLMSLADNFQSPLLGAILSGSGEDGVEGLHSLRRAGGQSVVQDPGSCLCEQMPYTAIRNTEIDLVVPDRGMADIFNRFIRTGDIGEMTREKKPIRHGRGLRGRGPEKRRAHYKR